MTESKARKPDDICIVFYQSKLSQIEAGSISEDGEVTTISNSRDCCWEGGGASNAPCAAVPRGLAAWVSGKSMLKEKTKTNEHLLPPLKKYIDFKGATQKWFTQCCMQSAVTKCRTHNNGRLIFNAIVSTDVVFLLNHKIMMSDHISVREIS